MLAVNRVAVLFCQMTVVLGAHPAFFLVDARFLVLKAGGLASSELSALHAVGDPVLLIDFALVDVLVILAGCRRGGRGGLGEHGGWGEAEGCDPGNFFEIHGYTPIDFSCGALRRTATAFNKGETLIGERLLRDRCGIIGANFY